MIFVNSILFIFAFIIITASLIGLGRFINQSNKFKFFENVFFGFIFLAFINTFIHFFTHLSLLLNIFVFLFGLLIFYKENLIDKEVSSKKFFYLSIIIALIPIFISQKYHEDLGYYHLPYALLLLEEKIIFGIANTNITYVYNSIWLNIYPSFFLGDRNYDFLTLSSFILFVIFVIYLVSNVIKDNRWCLSKLFSILLIFYFILKFTRISEYGVDLPSVIFGTLSILYFIKFFETSNKIDKKNYFFYNLYFSFFSILIKLSLLPIILLTIFLYLKNFKLLKRDVVQNKFLFIYLLSALFVIQQFIYTGCIIYPSELSCLNVNWFSQDFVSLTSALEVNNKSYSQARELMSQEEFLTNFNWFPFWFERNYPEITTHILTMLIPFVICYLYLIKKKQKNYFEYYDVRLYLLTFVLISLIFWLMFSPVYRFGTSFFVTAIFLFLSIIFDKKKITKNLFITIFAICLVFSFSKNLNRILKKDKVYFGTEKINSNKYIIENELENFKVFSVDVEKNQLNGWQGRLCWDIPIICSYSDVKLNKIRNYLFVSERDNN